MSHWSYACIEDPTDADDYISGDADRDERPIKDELDSLMHQLDMAIEAGMEQLKGRD